MQIVGALDVHRRQITHKTLDLTSGDVRRGRLSPANRQSVREWLERFNGCEAEKSALKRVTCPIDAG